MTRSPLQTLIRIQRRKQAGDMLLAALGAAMVGAASTLLLGLSGWFITASALAGAAGLAAAQAFNVLLPSAAIRALAILRTGARYLERLSGHAAALRALAAIRPVLFASLAAAPPAQALALSGGEASARLVQDVDAIETRFVRLSAPWGAAAAVLAGAVLSFLGGWAPALAILMCAGAAILAAKILAQRLSAPAGREIQTRMGVLKDAAASLAAAAPELRAYGLEDWAAQTLATRSQDLNAVRLDAARARGWIALSQVAITGLGVAAAVALAAPHGAALAALAGLAAAMAIEGVAGLASAFDQDGAAAQAADRLDAILRHAPTASPPAPPLLAPGLRLQGRDFAPGARIAILGPSGAGKTTLLERLLMLRAPSGDDTMAVGGVGLSHLDPATARAAFAHAPQDAALIAGSARDNLRLAAPDASDDALWAALQDAAIDTRIRSAPGGLDAWLGDNGERLSGGERRRLALARAYLRPAPWLLLDEPTEGLDAATEAQVLERLSARLDRTGQGVVLVSHRPAPLALCDQQILLERVPT